MNENLNPAQVLPVSTVYATYPELCKDLDLPVKSGRGKQTQLRELAETYTIVQTGRSLSLTPLSPVELTRIAEEKLEAALAKDCIRGEGEFADRKCQTIMLLWEQIRDEDSEDFTDFRDSVHFSKEIVATGIGFKALCSRLGLVNDRFSGERKRTNISFSESKRKGITNPELELDASFFQSVSAQNKRVLDTLFSHLWNTSLANGYKSFEVKFEQGQVGVLTAEDALHISTINEQTLETFGCTSLQEVYAKNLFRGFYASRNETLKATYGIVEIEDAYVTQTSEFLLSRYILRNVSKPTQKEMLRQLRLRENLTNIRKIQKRIQTEKETETLEATGWDEDWTEQTTEVQEKEAELRHRKIQEREQRKYQLVEKFVCLENHHG